MRAIALYECKGEDENELDFQEGDVIYKVEATAEIGWYRGEYCGRTGLFPGNYVRFEEDPPVEVRPMKNLSAGISGAGGAAGNSSPSMSRAMNNTNVTSMGGVAGLTTSSTPSTFTTKSLAKRIDALDTRRALSQKSMHLVKRESQESLNSSAAVHIHGTAASNGLNRVPPAPPRKSSKVLQIAQQLSTAMGEQQSPVQAQASVQGSTEAFGQVQPPMRKSSKVDQLRRAFEATAAEPAQPPECPFSLEELQRYKSLFTQIDRFNRKLVDGPVVRDVWLKSGLDAYALGCIWYSS